MTETRIKTLKEMYLITDLREGAKIVAPSDPAWRPLADRLQDLIRTHAEAGASDPSG